MGRSNKVGYLFVFIVLIFTITTLTGCATNPVTGKSDFVMMSEEQELALGRQEHQKVMQQFKAVDDPELQAYVTRLGEELAAKSHRDNLVYHFTVLDTPMFNAFALPGGYIYITRGIMAHMVSESQLVGVLGHEIGHVTARHSVRRHASASLAGILGAVATAATGNRAVGDLSNILGGAAIAGYGRKHELEADRLGAEYLARTNYDPTEMIKTIEILKFHEEYETARAKAEGRQPQTYHLFSTHPRNDTRLQELIDETKQYQTGPARQPDDEAFLKRMDGLVYGHGEDQGVLRGNKFYHKDLDLFVEFPRDWRVENLSDRLLATSKTNDSIFQLRLQDLNKKQTPEQFLKQAFKRVDDGQTMRIDGEAAYSGVVSSQTPWGQKPTRAAAIFRDSKKVFIAQAASKTGLPGDAFFDTVESMRRLHSNEKKLARARHVKIIRARKGDTFAKLAKKSALTNYAEDQLRLINGLYPDGEPTPGQLIKIVQ